MSSIPSKPPTGLSDPLAFISYRRQDTSAVSRWLAESIQEAFGPQSVFIDTEAIRVGDQWPKRIDAALSSASVLIVVIGPSWLRITDQFGSRRLDKENDWVRREIVHAIDNRKLILPLLVSQAAPLVREGLPPCLEPLLDHQHLELRDQHWESDRTLVLKRLERAEFKRTEARSQQERHELLGKESIIFSQQWSALKMAVSFVYGARITARKLIDSLNKRNAGKLLRELVDLQASIEDLLIKERALLPKHLFAVVHGVKHTLLRLCGDFEVLRRAKGSGTELQAIHKEYERLDRGYDQLVDLVQSHIGIGPASTI